MGKGRITNLLGSLATVLARRALVLTLSAVLIGLTPLLPGAAEAQSAPTLTRHILNVLCKFPDQSNLFGGTQANVQALFTATPGLNSYIGEESNGALNLSTNTIDWTTLPSPRSTYMPNNNVILDHPLLAAGCTGAAGTLPITSDTILVLWFNSDQIGSFTNAALHQTINGVSGTWPTIFLGVSQWNSPSIVAHEMGHAFGMGHSNFADFDPMASALLNGPLGPGYNAFHRDVAGWIPANRKVSLAAAGVPGAGAVTLTQLTQPDAVNKMIAYVPLANGQRYAIEYRRKVGYDASIPAEGVFIYLVPGAGLASASDVDSEVQAAGSGPGYEAEIWRPNEVFVDPTNHIKLSVTSVSGGTARVQSESYDAMPLPPTNLTVTASSANSLSIGWSEATPSLDAFLVQYRRSNTGDAWQQVKLPETIHAYTINNLTGSTGYDVSVQSCQGGIDDCTAQTMIATSTLGGPPAMPNATLGAVTATSANVSWSESDPSVSQYIVTLASQGSGGSCSTVTTPTVSASTFAYTMTGLHPNTGYCAWVTAVNGQGTTGSWPFLTFTTPAS
jgi:hypothetical protein